MKTIINLKFKKAIQLDHPSKVGHVVSKFGAFLT